jgi:polyhydroxybutyrate depolymerase
VACAVVLSACGAGAGAGSVSTTAAGGATTVAQGAAPGATQGCGSGAPGASTTLDIAIGGHRRVVVVHVPTGYTGADHVALVLNLHGSGASALDQEAFSGMDATADAKGFIVAYPQGVIPDGTGYDWNVPDEPLIGGRAVPAGTPDDVTFLTALVGSLETRYCVDAARVYATGFSGGARMVSQLACDASGTFAAVAPVSGLRHPTPCPAGRAVPVIAFHGTADPVDPFAGHGEGYWTDSVPTAAAAWGTQDGCGTAASTHTGAGFTLTQYAPCRDGSAVELYAVTGEGHEWPGGPLVPRALRDVLGPQSTALDADALMWAFFSAHPLS